MAQSDEEKATADAQSRAQRAADAQVAERAKLDAEVADLRARLADAERRAAGGGAVTVNAKGEVVS